MVIYVVGHKSPDSDAVCAAIAVAELKRQLGVECEARISEKINMETKFVLEKFGIEVPEILKSAKDKDIILVDHTELSQAVDGMDEANIVGIVDHHNLGDVGTDSPVDILVRPLGSTCTIVKGLFDFFKKEIPKDVAGVMLCALLSDTVIFRSPTTTDVDRWVAEELAEIAGVEDVEALGVEMFKVRSDIEGLSAKRLMTRNYKNYEMNGKKIGIGQLELAGLDEVLKMKDKLLKEAVKLKKGRYAVFLMLTDVLKQGTELICISNDEHLEKKVFGCGEDCWVGGMMSRKKQVVPRLEEFFE
jgi:manganese-dependent inorganic pyrophosphatase